MMSTMRERWTAWKYSTERELAPHVDEDWAERMIIELRLQGVSGPEIGSALSEVESHCAESHESAQHAFGDPDDYARSLGLTPSPDDTTASIAAAAAPTVTQVAGMLGLVWSFTAWARDRDLDITSGQLLLLTVLLVAAACLVRFSGRALRFVVTHPVATFVLLMTYVAASVGLFLLPQITFATAPAVPAMALAAALLVAGALWERGRTRRGVDEDPVTSPLDEPRAGSGPTGPTSRLSMLTYLTIPAYTVAMLAFTWWMTHL